VIFQNYKNLTIMEATFMLIVKVETRRRYGYIRKINDDDDDYVNGWWTPPESHMARTLFAY